MDIMKFINKPQRQNSKKRTITDLVFILIFTAIAFIITHTFDAFEKLHALSREYEKYEIDELFALLIIMAMALFIFSLRRWRDLRYEIREKNKAEQERDKAERLVAIAGLARSLSNKYEDIFTSIHGTVYQLLCNKNIVSDPEICTQIDQIKLQSDNGMKIASRILDMTNTEIKGIERVDLTPILKKNIEGLMPLLSYNDIKVTTKFSDLPLVKINTADFSLTITNLLIRAQNSFSDQTEKEIRISCYTRKDMVELSITDTGFSINRIYTDNIATLPKTGVFNNKAGTKESCSLFGLASSYELITQMGGSMSVESIDTGGTKITLWLPIAKNSGIY